MSEKFVAKQAEYVIPARRIAGTREEKLELVEEAIQELLEVKLLECTPEEADVHLLAVPRRHHWWPMTALVLALLLLLVLLLGVNPAHAQGNPRQTQTADPQGTGKTGTW
jgi:ferric-dicitrate binding protein FerR (iron transport regulator)